MQKNKSQVHLQKISKSQGSKLSLLTKKVGNLTVDVAKATQSKKDKRNAMRQERIEKKRKRDESIEELYDTEIEEEAASDSDMDMSESEDAPDGEDGDDKGSNEGTTEKAIPRKDERQKDTPCSWFQKGNCTRGDACFFSHEGIPDATKAPKGARGRPRQNAQPTRKRKQSKSPTLKNQKQQSATPDIDASNEEERIEESHEGIPDPRKDTPPRYSYSRRSVSDTPCSYFQKGNCTRGDACSFAHEGIPDATEAPNGARGRPRQNAQPTRKRKQSKSPTLKNQKQHLAMPDVDGEGGSNVEEPRRKKRRPKKQSKKKKVSGTAKESK